MSQIHLIGNITTASPFNVSMPGTIGIPKDSKGNPLIPASTLRGWLRHRGHEELTKLRAQHDLFFTVDEHYMLISGVDTARVVRDDESIGAMLKVRKSNPFLSLFGRWKFAGKLSVGSAVACKEDLVRLGNGVRTHIFRTKPSMQDFVKEDELKYLASILAADSETNESTKDLKDEERKLKRQLKDASLEEKKQINERLIELTNEMREIKDARVGASESIQRPLDGFEAIDADVSMPHRMILSNPSEDEFKMLLFVIIAASKEPTIGGHKNVGCGLVHCHWDVKRLDLEGDKFLGSIIINNAGITINIDGITIDDIIDFGKKFAISNDIVTF